MDKIHDVVEISDNFLFYLENKIKLLPESSFKNYLLYFYKDLNVKYNDFTYLDYVIEFKESLNLLFYLIKFYDNISKLNDFDFSCISVINNIIINNEFNYFDKNEKFINLNYIKLIFKSIDKNEIEKD